jgi:hypothetical protein
MDKGKPLCLGGSGSEGNEYCTIIPMVVWHLFSSQ